MTSNADEIARFASKTRRWGNGCLIWTGARSRAIRGYGVTQWCGKKISSHRLAWILANGKIPDGKFICHSCDITACVNINHLFLGGPKENSTDMVRKGRQATGKRNGAYTKPGSVLRGDNHGSSRLTERDVREILSVYKGKSHGLIRGLAKKYGVGRGAIGDIISGRTWRHVSI